MGSRGARQGRRVRHGIGRPLGQLGPMTRSISTPNERSRLADYLSGAGRRVDEALRRYLPEESEDSSSACPARLAAAMRYSVLGGGKRLRPLLCLMAAEACGGDEDSALPAACA